MFDEKYDVVVIGGGHAGCEAAHAAARIGLNTALYTMNVDLIAQMSCNPAVGGIAKGHLVREIDALGGVMGLAADEAGILTTGTCLNGLIHIGEKQFNAGRNGEPASIALGSCIRSIGFNWGRLKTGTPPRLDRRTINFAVFEEQHGDAEPTPFSFRTR